MASKVQPGFPRTVRDQRQSLLNPVALCLCVFVCVCVRVSERTSRTHSSLADICSKDTAELTGI